MVLKPLEFSESLCDSPFFRENLAAHEGALENTYKSIKHIEQQSRELVHAAKKLSLCQRSFAQALYNFKFESIGSNQTDEERVIANCLKEYARLISQVEDQRDRILEEAEASILEPLKRFRVGRIGKALNEDKKKFDKSSGKFYQSLEKHLHLSTVKKNDFKEADASLEMEQRHFQQATLDYVFVLQSTQERLKFEFVETVSSFIYSWLTFYHVGHVIREDFKPFLDGVQSKVEKTQQNFNATQEEAKELITRMLRSRNDPAAANQASANATNIKQGYLFLLEKKNLGMSYTKFYCVYQKESRVFTMIPYTQTNKHSMKETLDVSNSLKLISCRRRASDSIDKRFCFDITGELITERTTELFTFQALSEEDRRSWLDTMDGKEPVYSPGGVGIGKPLATILDDSGFTFMEQCLNVIENRNGSLDEQGLYRNCGVTSKVQKLLQCGLDRRKTLVVDLNDEKEWEVRTITSAVKLFLRNLPEPLMTFELHEHFIAAAKLDDHNERMAQIHFYVYKLPKERFEMLKLICRHLARVAALSEKNLMTVSNLGVCFGPTLLRPREETFAAIMDIKFCNVVVEVLVGNCETIFGSKPRAFAVCPPEKPKHVLAGAPLATAEALHSTSVPSLVSPMTPLRQTSADPRIAATPATTAVVDSNNGVSEDESRWLRSAPAQETFKTRSRQPMAAVGGSTSPSVSAQVEGAPPSLRRTVVAGSNAHDGGNNSCDSLNSLGSLPTNSESSPSPNRSQGSMHSGNANLTSASHHQQHQQPLTTAVYTANTRSGRGMSVSYAPHYPGDIYQKRHSGGNLLSNSVAARSASVAEPVRRPLLSGSTPYIHLYYQQWGSAVGSGVTAPSLHARPSCRVKTLYDCSAGHESELSFSPGQIITNDFREAGNIKPASSPTSTSNMASTSVSKLASSRALVASLSTKVRTTNIFDVPAELLDAILNWLSYDECSRVRLVCKLFNKRGGVLLNRGFRRLEIRHAKIAQQIKSQLPRRESERRNHHLSRHSDIVTAIETRTNLLSMTYAKFIDVDLCCFIPGKVLDELFNVLKIVSSFMDKPELPPRPHELLQELRDISSMAMEHFDEKIAPTLRSNAASTASGGRVTDSFSLALIGAFRNSIGSGASSASSASSSPMCIGGDAPTKTACPSKEQIHKLETTVRLQSTKLTELRRKSASFEAKLKEEQKQSQTQKAAIEAQNKKLAAFSQKFDEMQRQMIKYETLVNSNINELVNTHIDQPSTSTISQHATPGKSNSPTKRKLTPGSSSSGLPAAKRRSVLQSKGKCVDGEGRVTRSAARKAANKD